MFGPAGLILWAADRCGVVFHAALVFGAKSSMRLSKSSTTENSKCPAIARRAS